MSSNPLSFTSANYAPSAGASRKVAIPRLQRRSPPHGASKDRRRVRRACTACRAHKIKCSGDAPTCRHCNSTGRECMYIMPRRDRLKIVTDRCVEMSDLLRALRKWASEEDNAKIEELLGAVEEDTPDTRQEASTPSIPDTDGDDWTSSRVMLDADVVPAHDQADADYLDLLDENLHENDQSRATGFVGKNSEVQWLRNLLNFERCEEDPAKASMSQQRGSHAPGGGSEQVSAVTFYLDSENVDLDFFEEPSELPEPDAAERLLGVYMDKVHDSFPILPRRLFEDQFRKYFNAQRNGNAPRLNPKWQAILNLVFAIGAKYSHLVKAGWRADERDHLVYQARARAYGWNEATLSQHPDVPQIQVAGLLAFYYLSVGQVSRAWVVVGLALRFAYSLGLHVRNQDPSASAPKREVLVRVWWSLYSLERQLSIITGRPSVVVDSCCSVPLPMPLSEDQISGESSAVNRMRRPSSSSTTSSATTSPTFASPRSASWTDFPQTPMGFGAVEANSGAYFKATVQMGIITQSILSSLYTAGTMIRSASEIQRDIIQLGRRLDEWATSLPAEFNFQIRRSGVSTPSRAFFRERTLLGFQFCSARVLLTRPCLGGLWLPGKDGKDATVPISFFRNMAVICVDAAKMEIDFLPDQPNPLFVYEYGPWWNIVHHVMQAFTSFLLALSYSQLAPPDSHVLAGYAKKSIRWLRSMNDPLAARAYRVAFKSLELVANRLSLDVSDLWREHSLAFPNTGPVVEVDRHFDMEPVPMLTAAGSVPSMPMSFAAIPISVPHSAGPMLSSYSPVAASPTFAPPGGPVFDDPFYRRTG